MAKWPFPFVRLKYEYESFFKLGNLVTDLTFVIVSEYSSRDIIYCFRSKIKKGYAVRKTDSVDFLRCGPQHKR